LVNAAWHPLEHSPTTTLAPEHDISGLVNRTRPATS
jgi:hypothetical protein